MRICSGEKFLKDGAYIAETLHGASSTTAQNLSALTAGTQLVGARCCSLLILLSWLHSYLPVLQIKDKFQRPGRKQTDMERIRSPRT